MKQQSEKIADKDSKISIKYVQRFERNYAHEWIYREFQQWNGKYKRVKMESLQGKRKTSEIET